MTGHSAARHTLGFMPEVSRFLGIVISMYYREHGAPHFHAHYGDQQATVEMESGAIQGNLPTRALRHVREWAHLHRPELLANWERARRGEPLEPIDPLE